MPTFKPPSVELQIDFFHRLEELRHDMLLEALLDTISKADPKELDDASHAIVPKEWLKKVKGFGLATELAFVTPHVLSLRPRLIGYYRLLLGVSQKEFYSKRVGFGAFRSMEEKNRISKKQEPLLRDLCEALNWASWELIKGINVDLTTERIRELTLLTLGPQLRGSRNVKIGSDATKRVFETVLDVVKDARPQVSDSMIRLTNAAGRSVAIEFADDPDVRVYMELASGERRPILSMEIKGGTDVSNLHNRLGEANKSHLKAVEDMYREFWTILRFAGFNLEKARKESPETTRFFDIDEIAEPDSAQGRTFKELLRAAVGI